MLNHSKLMSFIFFIAILLCALPCHAKKPSVEEIRRADALKGFREKIDRNSAEVSSLMGKVSELKKVDIRKIILSDVPPDVRLRYGKAYLEIKNYTEALKNFYLASQNRDALDPDVQMQINSSLAKIWKNENSELSLKSYIIKQLKSRDYTINNEILDAYISSPYFDKADYELLKNAAAKKNLENDSDFYSFAKIALKFNDHNAALDYLQRIRSTGILEAKKLYALGVTQIRLSQYSPALASFQKCLHLTEDIGDEAKTVHDAATMAVARIQLHNSDYENAASLYSGIKDASPFFPDSLYETSYIYYKIGNITKAEEFIDYLLLASPKVKVHLDSLKFKGQELTFGGYDAKSPTKSYGELVSRIDFEKMKIKETIANYSGSENNILDILNADYVETRTKSIPTTLIVKSLRENEKIKKLLLIKKELSDIEEQVEIDSFLISTLKAMVNKTSILSSFQKTYGWLEQRSRAAFEESISLHENLSGLVEGAGGKSYGSLKRFRDKATKAALDLPDAACSKLEDQLYSKVNLQNVMTQDISGLISKSRDLNRLALTGWSLLDGERERLAINVKDDLSREFKNLKGLNEENSINASMVQSFENTLNRRCSLRSTALLNEYTTAVIKDISRIKGDHDEYLKSVYSHQEYIDIQKAYQNAYLLSDFSRSITDFLKKLKSEEAFTIAQFSKNLDYMRNSNSVLSTELLVLERAFADISKPVIRNALAKVDDLLNRYAIDYGWGLINSHFEAKRKTNNSLKEQLMSKEAELTRIEGNFKTINNDK